MNPSWVVIAGGSSLSVSPPQRNVSVPVAAAAFAVVVAPGCAAGAHAATIVAAPAARRRSRRVMFGDFIASFLPLETAGSIAPPIVHAGTPTPRRSPSFLIAGLVTR